SHRTSHVARRTARRTSHPRTPHTRRARARRARILAMAIKSSHASEIRALIQSLHSENPVDRDIAVARLSVLGERAVDRLVAAYPKAGRDARVGILRALEAAADPRALPVARSGLDEGGEIAAA